MAPLQTLDGFYWIGGHPIADFLNTVDHRYRVWNQGERLDAYSDLVRWARRAGMLSAADAEAALEAAAADPRQARRVLNAARDFRERLLQTLKRWLSEGMLPAEDSEVVRKEIEISLARRKLAWNGARLRWTWHSPVDAPVHAIRSAASELLATGPLGHLKICEGSDCDWTFVDQTPSRRRRWCTMSSCGNRAKVREHRERRRTAGGSRKSKG